MNRQVILNVSVKEEPEGGFSVVCTDLDVASQGETMDEALKNIKEAVDLYLESAKDLGIMDEVYERLGISEEPGEEVSIPKIFKTEIPATLAT